MKQADSVKGHILGTLSRTCLPKGLEFLIQAVALIKDKYPDIVCYIAGGTPKGEESREETLKNMVQKFGLEDHIVFLGEISDVESFFSKINVYISTSLWEGLPTAILEAFAAQTPVVATNVVGNSDLVKNLETGILVKAENSQAIAAGIEFAFENPEKIAVLAENAYRYGRENYSIDNMVKKYEILYESLTGQ
jgi:glycosyltransferase involved in cell wall biosynthesis